MPSIQKIKNKKGASYRVIIRKKGIKPITKTFKLRQHASEFIDSVYSNNNLLNHLGSLNDYQYKEISIKYKINRYGSLERVPQSYESRLKYWDVYLDKKLIHQINKLDIQQGLDELPNHLSPTTINKFKRAASAVFNFAINQDYLVHSPVRNIKSLKEPGGRLRYLSNEEKTSLLESCRHSHWNKLYLIVLMAITRG